MLSHIVKQQFKGPGVFSAALSQPVGKSEAQVRVPCCAVLVVAVTCGPVFGAFGGEEEKGEMHARQTMRNKQAMIASLSAGAAFGGTGQYLLFLWCCICLYAPFLGVEVGFADVEGLMDE